MNHLNDAEYKHYILRGTHLNHRVYYGNNGWTGNRDLAQSMTKQEAEERKRLTEDMFNKASSTRAPVTEMEILDRDK